MKPLVLTIIKSKKAHLLAGLVFYLLAHDTQAALIDRGNGMLYDNVLNITWLQDANLFKTQYEADNSIMTWWIGQSVADSPFQSHTISAGDFNTSTGAMNWYGAQFWANNLTYGGYDDWRLPTIIDTGNSGCDYSYSGTDCGWNSDTNKSELAHMYYNNLGFYSYWSETVVFQPNWGIFGNGTSNGTDNSNFGQNDTGLIKNLQANNYWSGNRYAPNINMVWFFGTGSGSQGSDYKSARFYAWAVRDGDVDQILTNKVSEPDTLLLIYLGFFGIFCMKKLSKLMAYAITVRPL